MIRSKTTWKPPTALGIIAMSGLAVACQTSTELELEPALDLPGDVEPPIQTDSLWYQLRFDGLWFAADIPYTYENVTGVPIYLANCNGGFSVHLERWNGEQWIGAWSPYTLACLSPPVTIAAGAVFAATLRVRGALPGRNTLPTFHAPDPAGTYRIVWDEGRTSYQDRYPFGALLPVAYRVSNSFELVLE